MDFDLFNYDKYIVSFSGGKDSTALLLFLIDNGVDKSKIELWHQEIDGRGENFFDWEVTPDYCKKLAEAFGVSVFFQWKDGGFKREMLRCNERTAKIFYECPDNTIHSVGGEKGKCSTRLKFPQPSPNLNVRWCSSYLKMMSVRLPSGTRSVLTVSEHWCYLEKEVRKVSSVPVMPF